MVPWIEGFLLLFLWKMRKLKRIEKNKKERKKYSSY